MTSPAFAQSASKTPVPTATSVAEDSGQLDDIVVTAQLRTEKLIDVPISITAVSGQALEERGLRNVRDFQFTVPNLTTYTTGNFSPNIIIRGISSEARNIGFESSLGVYVDGVFLGRSDAYTADLEDIERVEVLRGPQGTLFGKNTTSGAISITTRPADNTLSGFAIAQYGNYDTYRLSAGISGPLVRDRVYAKISAFASGRDGYDKNVNPTGPRDFDNDNARGVRGEVRVTPVDGVSISLKGDWSRNRYRDIELEAESIVDNAFGVPDDSVVPGIRTVNVDGNSDGRRRVAGTSLTADVEIGRYTLTSITAYRDLSSTLNLDLDGTSYDYLTSRYDDRSQQFTSEVRIASPADLPLRFVVGGYYFDQRATSVRDTVVGTATQAVLTGLGLPAALFDPNAISTKAHTRTQSIAAFVDGSYALTDKLSILFGGRVTDERKRLTVEQTSPLFLSSPGIFGSDPIFLDVPETHDRQQETNFSPTLGMLYKLSPSANAYLRYSKGFKSGGWNAELLGPNADPATTPGYFDVRNVRFSSESIENYEAGVKAELFGRKLRVNAAVFWMNYRAIQISRFVGGLQGYRTDNAGRARSRGFELEVAARPIPGLDLSGSVGYADARYVRYADGCGPGCDLDGTRLNAPAWTGAAGAQYTVPLTGTLSVLLRADYSYRSERAGTGTPEERLTNSLPAFSTVDARLGLTSRVGWSAELFARNLFDKAYYTFRGLGTDNALIGLTQQIGQYGPPRTYGVRTSYRF